MRAAVYCATRNLYPDILPAMKSLMAHSNVEKIYLLIEDDEFPFWLPEICETRNVSGQKYFSPGSPNYHQKWSYMVLLRAALWDIFPDLDRIFSLDVDTFCMKDVSDLWDLDMEHKCLAGSEETVWRAKNPVEHYINAGVLMMNLELLRSSGCGEQVVQTLNKRRWIWPEQDAFNVICEGSILFLPREYCAGKGTEPYGAPYIRHFMGEGATYRNSEIYKYWDSMTWEAVLKKWRSKF